MDHMELYGELTMPGGAAFPFLFFFFPQVGKQGIGVFAQGPLRTQTQRRVGLSASHCRSYPLSALPGVDHVKEGAS